MPKLFSRTYYSVLIGFLAAALGFSYALATSSTTEESDVVSRAAGTNPRQPLTFTNPFANGSTDRDLGDIALGSAIIRHIHARGGFSPYRFTSDRSTTTNSDGSGGTLFAGVKTLGEAEIAFPTIKPSSSTAAVFLNGRLSGQVGDSTGTIAPGTPLRFDVTVADSRGTNPNKHTETFRLTFADPSIFKIAQSTLNSGIQFNRYYDKIEVVNGRAPFTYTVTAVTVNGTTSSLDTVGLFLNKRNGVLNGRPLAVGAYAVTIDVVDSLGFHARSRDTKSVGQTVTFNIDPATRISADIFSTKASIKGDTAVAGKDTITYSGLINLAGKNVSDLDGLPVTLSVGSYTSPSVTLTGGKGAVSGPPAMSVSIGSDGTVKISIKNESFGTAMSIITNGELASSTKILALSLTVGDVNSPTKPLYQSAELVRFQVKAKSSKFDLEYKFGPDNLGGGFFITSVTGKDDKAETGDAWLVSFISLAPNSKKLATLGTVAQTTIGIGTDFFNSIATSVNGDTLKSTAKPDPKTAVVVKAAYNDKTGKGAVLTGLLPSSSTLPNTQTGILPALKAGGKNSPFPFLVSFQDGNGNELLGFEGSKRILPKGTTWITKGK